MLKAYAFDIDSNLLFTDTPILMEKLNKEKTWELIHVTQEEYELYKHDKEQYRHKENNIEASMKYFRGSNVFEKDIFAAITNKQYGPSWEKFIEANTSASPIAFTTARGHPVQELENTHKKIIYTILSDNQRTDLLYSIKERTGKYTADQNTLIDIYIQNNFYAPCSNTEFLSQIGKQLSDPLSTRKNAAFEQFIIHIKKVFETYYGANFIAQRKIRVGFSDDSYSNIEGLHTHIHTEKTGMMRRYPEILFRMYDTGNKDMPVKFSYNNDKTD